MRKHILAAALAAMAGQARAECVEAGEAQRMMIGVLVCKAAGAYDGLAISQSGNLPRVAPAQRVYLKSTPAPRSMQDMLFCARAAAYFLSARSVCRANEMAKAPLATRQRLAAAETGGGRRINQ